MDIIEIGAIKKSFGLGGQVWVSLISDKKNIALKLWNPLFVEKNKNNWIPYFVKKATYVHDSTWQLTLEDVLTLEQATQLLKRRIGVPSAVLSFFVEKDNPILLVGFAVYDNNIKIGVIHEMHQNTPQQLLAAIMHNDIEKLIPIHDAFIVKIDSKKQEIFMALPEGILDL